jgi:hypothetical protein
MLAVEFIDFVWLIGIAVPGEAIKNGSPASEYCLTESLRGLRYVGRKLRYSRLRRRRQSRSSPFDSPHSQNNHEIARAIGRTAQGLDCPNRDRRGLVPPAPADKVREIRNVTIRQQDAERRHTIGIWRPPSRYDQRR